MAGRRALTWTGIGTLFGAALGLILWRGIPGDAAEPLPVAAGPVLTPVAAPLVGARAPEFSAQSVDGMAVLLSEQRGRPVVLNFWATWCEPCRSEMPLLEAKAQGLADRGLVVLGVNFDEPAEIVRAFRSELDLTFPLLLDPGGEIQSLYRVVAYPTTYFVDGDGIIRAVHLGVMDEGMLDDYLAGLGLG